MNFIFWFLFYLLGIFIGSFGVIQLLIILFFGIPFTNELNENNLLTDYAAIKRHNYISFAVILSTTAIATFIIIHFASNINITSYFMGIITMILFGSSQLGKTQNNIEDYLKNNLNYIDTNKLLCNAICNTKTLGGMTK